MAKAELAMSGDLTSVAPAIACDKRRFSSGVSRAKPLPQVRLGAIQMEAGYLIGALLTGNGDRSVG